MEENKIKRTVKKSFLTADKVSRMVKCVGGYAGPFIASMALNALNSKSKNGDNDENESEDNNE